MGSPVLDNTDVLRFIAEGMTDRQIGKQLYLSESGAGFRVKKCFDVLGASTRAQAVAEAHRQGLLSCRCALLTPTPKRPLTDKQRWLIALVAEGLTYGEIGARYSQSEGTIRVRLMRIRRNVGARNGAHLVHLAFAHRLFPAGWNGGDRRGR